jgi:hypothetical protein
MLFFMLYDSPHAFGFANSQFFDGGSSKLRWWALACVGRRVGLGGNRASDIITMELVQLAAGWAGCFPLGFGSWIQAHIPSPFGVAMARWARLDDEFIPNLAPPHFLAI